MTADHRNGRTDSAHWSDRDSALLMRTLLSSALIERLLVILSYRRGDGADSPLLGDLDRLERARPEIGWRQLDLLPLPDEEVKSLARALLSADTSDEVVDAIALESAACMHAHGVHGMHAEIAAMASVLGLLL